MAFLRNLVDSLGKLFSLVGILLLAGLILMSVGDALSRNLLGVSIRGTIESTEAVLVAIVYLGLAGAYRAESHISADIALKYFPQKLQQPLAYLAIIVGAVLLALLCWFAWEGALESVVEGEMRWGAVQMPIWPGKLALAVGLTALWLELLLSLLNGPQESTAT